MAQQPLRMFLLCAWLAPSQAVVASVTELRLSPTNIAGSGIVVKVQPEEKKARQTLHLADFLERTAAVSKSESEIIMMALEATGLTNRSGVRAQALRIADPGKTIPNIPSEPVWKVHLENAPLLLVARGRLETNAYVKRIDLVYSERRGMLIALITPWPENTPGDPLPPPEVYEKTIGRSDPIFTGIPDTPPKLSLLEALGNDGSRAFQAKQVVVYYVLAAYPSINRPPRPSWVIHAQGIPHIWTSGAGPGASAAVKEQVRKAEALMTHWRTVVDAETGYSRSDLGAP